MLSGQAGIGISGRVTPRAFTVSSMASLLAFIRWLEFWLARKGRGFDMSEMIKLSTPINTPAALAFMADFESQTINNPFAKCERVWDQRACLDVFARGNGVVLAGIRALEFGKGNGSAALEWLKGLAIKHGVSIRLQAVRFGRHESLSNDQLCAWYERHGFLASDRWHSFNEELLANAERTL